MNKCLLVVDVQEGYHDEHDGCKIIVDDVVSTISKTKLPVLYMFVGRDILPEDQATVSSYLLNNGLKERHFQKLRFIEKDYGFYRSWMDENVPDEIILDAVKYMEQNDIWDTTDIDDETLEEITGDYHFSLCRNLPMYRGDFTEKDRNLMLMFDQFEVCGGGANECLKEMLFFLKAHNKDVKLLDDMIYGGEVETELVLEEEQKPVSSTSYEHRVM